MNLLVTIFVVGMTTISYLASSYIRKVQLSYSESYLARCNCSMFMMSYIIYYIVSLIFSINIIVITIIIILLLFDRP